MNTNAENKYYKSTLYRSIVLENYSFFHRLYIYTNKTQTETYRNKGIKKSTKLTGM